MRLAIVGSRKYPHLDKVATAVRALPLGTVVISGGASGVDTVAAVAALNAGLELVEYLPNFAKYGPKRAPLERNKLIASDCDAMLAFHDGISTGTLHVMGIARRLGKRVEVIGAGPTE